MSDPLLDQLDALIASDTDGLLDEPTKPAPVTEVDRLHRAFHEIEEFYAANGREPDPNTMDIAERKFGARLVGIRASAEKKAALADADEHGLLAEPAAPASSTIFFPPETPTCLGIHRGSSTPRPCRLPASAPPTTATARCE